MKNDTNKILISADFSESVYNIEFLLNTEDEKTEVTVIDKTDLIFCEIYLQQFLS